MICAVGLMEKCVFLLHYIKLTRRDIFLIGCIVLFNENDSIVG